MSKNLELWNSVYQTDPAHTKGFQKGGGFKGTAIKPYWLMKRATETFGPCGIGWGWEEMENKMVSGVWCSKVRLWYRLPPETPEGKAAALGIGIPTTLGMGAGQIEQWGQTVMEGTNKNGSFVDEEAPKKAVTDAVTKCLSYLGFGGDVHMGLFDDSKYVEKAAKAQTAKARNEEFAEIKAALAESDDPATTWGEYKAAIEQLRVQDPQFYDDLVKAAKQRKEEIAKHDAEVAAFGQGFVETR